MSDFNNRSNDRRSGRNESSGWKRSDDRNYRSREQGSSNRNSYGKKRFWSADDDNRRERNSNNQDGYRRNDSQSRNFEDRNNFEGRGRGFNSRGRNSENRNNRFSDRNNWRHSNDSEDRGGFQNRERGYRDRNENNREKWQNSDHRARTSQWREDRFEGRGREDSFEDRRNRGRRDDSRGHFRDNRNQENFGSGEGRRRFSDNHGGERRRFEKETRGGRRRFEDDSARRDFNRTGETPRGRDSKLRNHNEDRQRRAESQRLQDEIPNSITPESLDAQTRMHLRSLNRENAEVVARHLAYAGEMMDIEPEVAYRHSQAAFQRAARVDVVREALGLTAYVTGRYSEALSELRTYRRMSDDYTHVPIEADAERGMGRSEKALQFIAGVPLARLNPEAKVELAIVASGARADLGDFEGGLKSLEKIKIEFLPAELAARVQLVRADRLSELGREEEAQALRAEWEAEFTGEDLDRDLVLDLDDMLDDLPATPEETEFEVSGARDEIIASNETEDFNEADVSDLDTELSEDFTSEFEDEDFDAELEAALDADFADEEEN